MKRYFKKTMTFTIISIILLTSTMIITNAAPIMPTNATPILATSGTTITGQELQQTINNTTDLEFSFINITKVIGGFAINKPGVKLYGLGNCTIEVDDSSGVNITAAASSITLDDSVILDGFTIVEKNTNPSIKGNNITVNGSGAIISNNVIKVGPPDNSRPSRDKAPLSDGGYGVVTGRNVSITLDGNEFKPASGTAYSAFFIDDGVGTTATINNNTIDGSFIKYAATFAENSIIDNNTFTADYTTSGYDVESLNKVSLYIYGPTPPSSSPYYTAKAQITNNNFLSANQKACIVMENAYATNVNGNTFKSLPTKSSTGISGLIAGIVQYPTKVNGMLTNLSEMGNLTSDITPWALLDRVTINVTNITDVNDIEMLIYLYGSINQPPPNNNTTSSPNNNTTSLPSNNTTSKPVYPIFPPPAMMNPLSIPNNISATTADPFVYNNTPVIMSTNTNAISANNTNQINQAEEAEIESNEPTPPIIYAQNLTVPVGAKFNFMDGITSFENNGEGDDITNKVTISGKVNTAKVGDYEITYKVTDQNGLTTTKKIIITISAEATSIYPTGNDSVSDPNGPIINAKDIVVPIGKPFNLMKGITAFESGGEGDNITKKVTIKGVVNTAKPGKYKITYQVTDANGKKATKTITVTVK